MYQDEALKNVLPIQECYDYVLSSDKRTAAFNRLFESLQWYSAKSDRTLKWYSMASDDLGAICLAIIYMLCELPGQQ